MLLSFWGFVWRFWRHVATPVWTTLIPKSANKVILTTTRQQKSRIRRGTIYA